MSAFSARLLKNAIRQLKKLDPKVARRIAEQITWLSEHFEEIRAEPLKGDLAGLFKYREGDYRIITLANALRTNLRRLIGNEPRFGRRLRDVARLGAR